MKFRSYTNHTFKQTDYYRRLPAEEKECFNVLTTVFHFKVNNYVLENLIDWEAIPNDPLYKLLFPRKEMLSEIDYIQLKLLHDIGFDKKLLIPFVQQLKSKMVPEIKSHSNGMVKLAETMQPGMYSNFGTIISLSPSPMMRTCHSYCSYCFRWIIFNNNEIQNSQSYEDPYAPVHHLMAHPEISDVLFTGADPLVLKADKLKEYIGPILDIDSVQVIRISSKSLAWWPYRFLTDNDADNLLELFEYIQTRGKHLNFCAHFTHPRELENEVVQQAVQRIRSTGTMIRCQGPLVEGINDFPEAWSDLWTKQIQLGMVPYYMFVEANHHSENCFRIPMARALRIFQEAQKQTTGLARTVRGPVFMNDLNRVLLDGTTIFDGRKYFVLKSLQCPPGTHSEGRIRLIPYDEHTTDFGDLFALFEEEDVIVS